eukprot:jgi/Hompol1/2402/HPOL_002192-RA
MMSALFDLLGHVDFDFLTLLSANRKKIVDTIVENAMSNQSVRIAALAAQNSEKEKENSKARSRPQQTYGYGLGPGTQVTVVSESEKQQMKQQRKEAKKQMKQTKDELDTIESATLLGFDGNRLRQARIEQLQANASAPMASNKGFGASTDKPQYPNVYQSSSTSAPVSAFLSKVALPAGTERYDEQDYEEIIIPIARAIPPRSSEKRIMISDMDPLARAVFKGYQSLNRVQSIVYPVAYETNENMLVCAPTGAGKTDVAMLTVLRTISQHVDEYDFIDLLKFKIIYVAPMK